MKTVRIHQGLPGSGKSTAASTLVETLPIGEYVICNADTFHLDDEGNYNFKPENAGKAHSKCLLTFLDAIQYGIELVVVDNTNTTLAEMAPYAALAHAFGYKVKIFRYDCKVETACSRNTHGVPESTIKVMHERMEDPLERWGEFEVIKTDPK